MVINHLLSGMVLQESAPAAMPAQKGKSCLERRLKRCQTDVQIQGQPLQPCIAPRALRGHSSSRVEILSAHYTTPAPIKTSLQKHHHTSTKTPPQDHKTTTISHHHKNTPTPPQKHNHTTNTTTPPPQKHHKKQHHHNNAATSPQKPHHTTTPPPQQQASGNWAHDLPLTKRV